MFSNGLRHGKGTLVLEGRHPQRYDGEWVDDQKHGWGIMTFASGDVYEGNWRHDKKDGFGKAIWTGVHQKYQGYWKDNIQCGLGEHVWFGRDQPRTKSHASIIRQNRYVGLMANGRRNAEGTMFYSTGMLNSTFVALCFIGKGLGLIFQILLHILTWIVCMHPYTYIALG
jgi:hypothetical protein